MNSLQRQADVWEGKDRIMYRDSLGVIEAQFSRLELSIVNRT